MAKVLARSADTGPSFGWRELEEIYDRLRELRPKDRVEIINGRIVVSQVPTKRHELHVFRLTALLIAATVEHRWMLSASMQLFLGAQRDRYRSDLTVMPVDAPMWGDDHVYGDATALVVEVVSKSSIDDDHRHKPRGCAAAGVPLYLVIDGFAGTIRLLSKPDAQTERYEQQVEVQFGKPLELPEPWNLTLDTAKLAD